ncbi:Ribosomal protein L15 [Halorhabdus sp. SVX81]|nr:Ribosomal protein L15 [Halorhabdus sp. SVX81]
MHNYPPIGKSGFTRPEKAQDDVSTVEVKTLDEDAALLAADGVAEETDGGYEIDARDVVEDGYEVDVVKVLGGGQVRNELTIVADAFSDAAREKIEAAGGTTELSDRGEQRQDKEDADADSE